MGAVEAAARSTRYENSSRTPKVFIDEMVVETGPHNIALADVNRWQIVIGDAPYQDIDARATELRALLDLRPFLAGKGDAESGPVHPINDAQSFGVSIGNKDADSVGVSHGWPKN